MVPILPSTEIKNAQKQFRFRQQEKIWSLFSHPPKLKRAKAIPLSTKGENAVTVLSSVEIKKAARRQLHSHKIESIVNEV